jgi:putative ABC transport system permease protein
MLAGHLAGPKAYYAAGEWLKGFAYHFKPSIGIFLVTVLMTLVIALISVGYQSILAALANPVDSLKHE